MRLIDGLTLARHRCPKLTWQLYSMVRTKSGGNRAISPEFVITGLIFYPSRVES
jgi:hypothetical protein